MSKTNFLIGRGELLTHDIKGPRIKPSKADAYSLPEAKKRLAPQIVATAKELNKLPADACPADFAVARFTMNPSYIAKSFFPNALLRRAGLESIGSKTRIITPDKWTKKGKPSETATTEIFVAGRRTAFSELVILTNHLGDDSPESDDLTRIERVEPFLPEDRIFDYGDRENLYFEVGLHLLPSLPETLVKQSFEKYAEEIGVTLFSDYNFTAGNLWFIPAKCDHERIKLLSRFSFIRVIRPVPKLRGMRPTQRAVGTMASCSLPTEQPWSSEPKVAVLDGGLPDNHGLDGWLNNNYVMDANVPPLIDGPDHGLAVTSSLLFGPILPGNTADRPYSYVDHIRVLDGGAATEDPLELYRTLGHIEEVLLSKRYEFINLSLGPDLPIEDTEVHSWTSVIDDLLSDGDTFMTVAVGNNGLNDRASGNARVQVPSDCVNAIAVGSSSNLGNDWERAPYSAIGPGRSPGIIKPDLMAFGGTTNQYFHVLSQGANGTISPQQGTSFAAPYLLRTAVGIKAVMGSSLTPLAIKGLLVHAADPLTHDKSEVGWGKVPEDIMQIVSCSDGVARIVYQGELKPGKYLRAQLPVPDGGLTGNVKLKATFCYASPTDPQDSASYTKAGLKVTFRPNVNKKKNPAQKSADTRTFFEQKSFATEEEQRADSGKWETVLHGAKNMRGNSLEEPVFDIHYNAREAGGPTTSANKITYALIITVEAPKHPDLYNDILRTYAKALIPIQPQVSIPVRI